ncbi:MAG: thioredoxin-dependent thiol peroxidase [Elusimicrobiota bacterium]
MLKAGDKAPNFSAVDDQGKTVKLSDFKGKQVVLYFYPKDMTPGCTTEACAFRDRHALLKKKGAVVLGVSKDSAASHAKFKEKYGLPFPLLADENLDVIKAYGAWGERSLYGRKFMGILRSTVVIGADGRVKAVFPKVKVNGHAEEVLRALDGGA